MGALVKLSLGAFMAVTLMACSTTIGSGSSDSGTQTDTGTTPKDGGSDTSTGDDGGACTLKPGSSPGQGAACEACVQGSCCEQWNKCFNDTSCDTLATCVYNCINTGGTGTDAGDGGDPIEVCKANCASGASSDVIKALNTAVGCVQDFCISDNDAGTLPDGGSAPCQ